MTSEEWARVKRIVTDALSQGVADRTAYLDRQCANDERLRGEARSLLASAVVAEHLYEHPTLLIDGDRIRLEALSLAPMPTFVRDVQELGDEPTQDSQFAGTKRYAVRRQIGVGGMGVVYEVDDRSRHQIVALKTLRRWKADDIYRLKREFRSLADIAHLNLACLYDLVVEEDQCFFTMELVDGVPFVDYVRRIGSSRVDVDRLRRTLPQLVEGVRELHRRGKLHRDIKPSNVLVTAAGRVVILDFGLTSNLADDAAVDVVLEGTPAYVSPEQCDDGEATEASDWYCVGVTLYHALTGSVPFEGPMREIIRRKTTEDPIAPSRTAPEIPADLDDICLGLLHRDPKQRMTGAEVLRRLNTTAAPLPAAARDTTRESTFVGRERYLDVLHDAFTAVKQGGCSTVFIHGPSGIGKSALVQAFLDRLQGQSFVALRSKCYEHESIPYKGLDGIVDGLSRYLATLPKSDALPFMPRDAAALARLFPVMHFDVKNQRDPVAAVDDAVTIRRRAFAALREIVSRIASRQPIVLHIDDFHWADPDSVNPLVELLRPPHSPALLLLVSFRSEEIESNPFLRGFMDRVDLGTTIRLPLAPMSENEVARLMSTLWPGTAASTADERVEIAREASGNPYLVEELTRYMALEPGARPGASLEEMLRRRLDGLPPESRAFLETLAVCGRPIMTARLFEACGLTGDERPFVARLRAAHFLRNSRSGDHVEMYHDRIRETLAAAVPDDAARQIHELMARILVAHGDDDPEALFHHYRAAGHERRAATQAVAAAERAGLVLAFDRAAAFYRHALALQPDADRRAEWTAGLARALENAGRPVDAATAYLDAARRVHDRQRIEWLRKGAEQLLMGGHIDRGLEVIDEVLRTVGMQLARGPKSALASMLLRRVELGWRGLDFAAREEAQIAREDLLRIDTCWAISTGLMLVDTLRAASLNVRQLLLALRAGEPYRVARALALEACFSAAAGGPAGIERSNAFAARARGLAERVQNPHVIALSSLTSGVGAFVLGQWTNATDLCETALTILREQCTGVVWEMTLAQNFFLGSLMYRGQMRHVSHLLPVLLQSARERGNLYFETEISTRMSLAWLCTDKVEDGERQAQEAIRQWSDSGFHRQHYNYLIARVQIALYRGRFEEAWTLVTDHLPRVRRNLWLRVQFMRTEINFLQGRCALAIAAAGGQDAPRLRALAARRAARIAQEDMPWSNPLAKMLRATLACQSGDESDAVRQLSEAVSGLTSVDMQLYAAATRRRLATLVGGDRRQVLQRESDDYMAAQGIRNPAAITRLLLPGFPD